jgi:hypothetical protein
MASKLQPDHMLGFMLGARGDREMQSADYNLALSNANRLQSQMAAQKNAADQQAAEYKLLGTLAEHPDQAYMFSGTRKLIAPDMMPHGYRLGQAAVGLTEAKAREANMHAVQYGAEGGALPPQGTGYSLMGVPSAGAVQGVPQDTTIAGINAAARVASAGKRGGGGDGDDAGAPTWKAGDVPKLVEGMNKIDRDELDEVNRTMNAIISGQQQVTDRNGQIINPQRMTPDQRTFIMDEVKARAKAAADAQRRQLREAYGASGLGRRVPQGFGMPAPAAPAPGTTNNPAASASTASAAPTMRPDGGPPLQVGGPRTGASAAATAPENQRAAGAGVQPHQRSTRANADVENLTTHIARNGGPQARETAARLIDRAAAAGGGTVRLNTRTGEALILDRSGNVVETGRYR